MKTSKTQSQYPTGDDESSIPVKITTDSLDLDHEDTIYFAGDFALSHIPNDYDPSDYFDSAILDDIAKSKVSLLNYEGVIPNGQEDSSYKSGIYNDEKAPGFLSEVGFSAVAMANNHMLDYGPEQLIHTLKKCADINLRTVGAGENRSKAVSPLRYEFGETSISIFNFSEHNYSTYSYHRSNSDPFISEMSDTVLIQRIVEERSKADVMIAVAHGGEEGIPIPPIQLKQRYRQFIDIGIDIIVGGHPHVAQGWEQYESGVIFYSLGDYLFEYNSGPQYWGVTLQCSIDNDGINSIFVTPIKSSNNYVEYSEDDQNIENLKTYNKIIDDDKKHSMVWMTIANQMYKDRKYFFDTNKKEFLKHIFVPSHRSTIETALVSDLNNVQIPQEIENKAYQMWSWTGNHPYDTKYARYMKKVVNLVYTGIAREIITKLGLHPYLYNIYYWLLSYLSIDNNCQE